MIFILNKNLMKMIIIKFLIILMIYHINTCEGMRGLNMNKYVKNINKIVYKKCNKEAFNITNNIEIYKCLLVNNSNICSNLDNYTDYNKIRFLCIKKFNSNIGNGIFISIIIWMIIGLCFH